MVKSNRNDQVSVNIGGNVNNGQIGVGSNITQTQSIRNTSSEISEADRDALHKMIEDVKAQIIATAPPDKQGQALEQVSELENAITAKKPDLTTMEYVKNWFGKNIPQLAGAVTGLVVNPIVGKLVEAAGEAIVHEFKLRFDPKDT